MPPFPVPRAPSITSDSRVPDAVSENLCGVFVPLAPFNNLTSRAKHPICASCFYLEMRGTPHLRYGLVQAFFVVPFLQRSLYLRRASPFPLYFPSVPFSLMISFVCESQPCGLLFRFRTRFSPAFHPVSIPRVFHNLSAPLAGGNPTAFLFGSTVPLLSALTSV